jgi:hypothetical protein
MAKKQPAPVTDIGAAKLRPIPSPYPGDDRQYFVRDNETQDLVVLELRSAREGLATHGRVINDPLDRLDLSPAQLAAGKSFQATFDKARLGPHYAKSTLFRVDGAPPQDVEDAITKAKQRIERIHRRVGNLQYSVLWDVCGCGFTVPWWAKKQAAIMAMSNERARGILMAALDTLANFRD